MTNLKVNHKGLAYDPNEAIAGDYTTNYQNMGDVTVKDQTTSDQSSPQEPNAVAIPIWPRRRKTYRGFSSSICDMFRNRYDCCAIACCGILSYDRTRYLLTGQRPTPLRKRLFLHLLVPLIIFILAGYTALYIKDQNLNETVCKILILTLFAYILMDCIQGRDDRLIQRNEVLQRAGTTNEEIGTDAGCAHACCIGCYKIDGHWDQWDENDNETSLEAHENVCTSLWKYFSAMFCGICAKCYCQVCGICAIAQEAREMERLVEPKEKWIDYITFEPFGNFYYKIVKLRISQDPKPWSHYKAVSKLSKILLKTLAAVIVSLVLLSFLSFNTMFTYQNVLVFVATFLQAFLILYVIHWRNHKFELSLDAVIKYFACGFLLITGIAICFESIISIILEVFLITAAALGGRIEPQEASNDKGDNVLTTIGMVYPTLAVIYLFFNSFLLAATVEELCKYFGYIMVEHPDLMILETNMLLDPSLREVATEAEDDIEEEDHSDDEDSEVQKQETPNDIPPETELNIIAPKRSLNIIGVGITIAMVAVALGFACCENLLYIFVYSGGDVQNELGVLLARSAFPIHPLAAAIQSINVCRHTLEKESTMRIGRIITPSLLLHGSFDFSLMVIALFADIRAAREQEDQFDAIEDDSSDASMLASSLALAITVAGAVYYWYESDKQKKRLDALEQSMQTLLT